jgi:hypothetical protein
MPNLSDLILTQKLAFAANFGTKPNLVEKTGACEFQILHLRRQNQIKI